MKIWSKIKSRWRGGQSGLDKPDRHVSPPGESRDASVAASADAEGSAGADWKWVERDENSRLRLEARMMIQYMNERALGAVADCALKFDFLLRGWKSATIKDPARMIDKAVGECLNDFYALPSAERVLSSIEPLVAHVWKDYRFKWPSPDESDSARLEVSAITRDYVETFHDDPVVVSRSFEASARVSNSGLEIGLSISRLDLDEFEGAIEVVSYDFAADPDTHRFELSNDPVAWAWVIAVTDTLHRPVSRVRNQFIRHGTEEVWTLSPGDVERVRGALDQLALAMRFDIDPKATPGSWCAECGFRNVCSESDLRSLADLSQPKAGVRVE